jgi:hypothetical protein
LLEVRHAGQPRSSLYLVEIETYPANDVPDQLLRDTLLVFLNRNELPEVVVLVLRPKGQVRVADRAPRHSPQGWTQLTAGWRVVELWTLPAAELLALDDPGLRGPEGPEKAPPECTPNKELSRLAAAG